MVVKSVIAKPDDQVWKVIIERMAKKPADKEEENSEGNEKKRSSPWDEESGKG